MQHSVRNVVNRPELGPRLGLLGATLGILAGVLELTIGPSIRTWVGNKQDTAGLGSLTIMLSIVAVTASLHALRNPGLSGARRFAVVLLLFIPAVICFTTVGSLWYVPGPLLIASAIHVALVHSAIHAES